MICNSYSGHWTIRVNRAVVAIFPNLITDVGLHVLAGSHACASAALGTDTAAPTNSDTTITGAVYSTSVQSQTFTTNTGALYREHSTTFLWEVGTAVGNFSTIGVLASDGRLYSKARIPDALGQPTTIPVTATDFVEATYTQREYVDGTDHTFSGFVVDGASKSGIVRPVLALANPQYMPAAYPLSRVALVAYSGALNPLPTDNPPSGYLGETVGTLAAYTDNYKRQATFTFARTNAVGSIKSLVFLREVLSGGYHQTGYMHAYGIEFSTPVEKPNTLQLSLTLEWSWGRYVAP